MTDDLPTPPLPLPTAMHARGGGDLGRAAPAATRAAGRAASPPTARSWVISPYSTVDRRRRPGGRATFDWTSLRDLAAQRAAGGGERDLHRDVAVGVDRDVVDHAEVDDRGVELGVEDPASMPRTSSGVGGGWEGGMWASRSVMRHHANKTSVDLENMPDPEVPSSAMDLLAVLKALGDETRFSMYASSPARPARCSAPGARRPPRPARQHRAPPPRAPARSRPGRGRGGPPRHGRPAPAPLLAGAGRARAWASTRRATRCSPGCSPRWPSGSAPTATRPTEIGRAWGVEAGRRTRSRSCVQGARRRDRPARLRARRPRPSGGDVRHRVPALPVPGAGRGLPRAGLQPPPRDLRRRRREVGGGSSRGLRDVVRPGPVPGHGCRSR